MPHIQTAIILFAPAAALLAVLGAALCSAAAVAEWQHGNHHRARGRAFDAGMLGLTGGMLMHIAQAWGA